MHIREGWGWGPWRMTFLMQWNQQIKHLRMKCGSQWVHMQWCLPYRCKWFLGFEESTEEFSWLLWKKINDLFMPSCCYRYCHNSLYRVFHYQVKLGLTFMMQSNTFNDCSRLCREIWPCGSLPLLIWLGPEKYGKFNSRQQTPDRHLDWNNNNNNNRVSIFGKSNTIANLCIKQISVTWVLFSKWLQFEIRYGTPW